jgi:long-chain acyl-CoA synthetase
MTEGANLTSANIDTDTKPYSMGKIYPLQEVKIVEGELWIRGDNLMKGYYKNPEATAKVLTEDGWFKTGDLVSFDEEGFITILGRTNNLIILPNGENVSPEEIEDIFNRSDLIQDCLVKEDISGGKPVLAIEILPLPHVIQEREWEEVTSLIHEEVKRINDTLPSFKQVSKISVRKKDFKRTGAMKIDRLNS